MVKLKASSKHKFNPKVLGALALRTSKIPMVKFMFTVGVLTLLAKVFGFYKEMVIASEIGLSELLDTYYIALLIPGFLQTVFIGSLNNLFIPNYITELSTSNKKGEFQTVSFIMITILVAILTLLCLVFSAYFLEMVFPGHPLAYYELIRSQLYIILPSLLFWGYSGMFGGLLEINNKFFFSSLSPILISITFLVCLFAFRAELGNMVLAVGTLAGAIVTFLFQLFFVVRKKILEFAKPVINPNIRLMMGQLPPKISSGLLTGLNSFVDQFFAAQLVVGSIAAINYGTKIPAFVVGIIIMVIGAVLLPHFSRMVNTDLQKAYKQLFRILKIVFFGALIATLFAYLFSNQIIELLFERKEFKAEDTLVVARIQQIAILYVPFYLCTLVCVRFLTAINKNKFMAWTSFWNLGLNLVLNIILMQYYGVYGLVASTTVVYIIASFVYVGFTYKQFKALKAAK
ncbi:murein biosynthesis integral membrane protein MurJ [Maribacter sp. ACAM166]|uniref:murein biosynthesis integral membrane protein MurJ n=1 Tax=Maribacter sp. ACAM166 TaxID=2508996 RepID=UPI002016C988|nr:lipid II flippase MurJ [Maribacter sp. ACAM166]